MFDYWSMHTSQSTDVDQGELNPNLPSPEVTSSFPDPATLSEEEAVRLAAQEVVATIKSGNISLDSFSTYLTTSPRLGKIQIDRNPDLYDYIPTISVHFCSNSKVIVFRVLDNKLKKESRHWFLKG